MSDAMIATCLLVVCAVAVYAIAVLFPLRTEDEPGTETLVDWDTFQKRKRDPEISRLCCTHHMDCIQGHVADQCERYGIDPTEDCCMRDAVFAFLVHNTPPAREEFEAELDRLWQITGA
jgi:hypothetical protein